MDKIVIKQSLRKMILLLLGSALLTAMGAFCILEGIKQSDLVYSVVGILGVLYFGFYLICYLYRILKPKDILVIDENGVTDQSTVTSVGEIPWDNIECFYKRKLLFNKYICVKLKDNQKILSQLKPWKRTILKLNTPSGFEVVSITLDITDAKIDNVLEQLDSALEEYQYHQENGENEGTADSNDHPEDSNILFDRAKENSNHGLEDNDTQDGSNSEAMNQEESSHEDSNND